MKLLLIMLLLSFSPKVVGQTEIEKNNVINVYNRKYQDSSGVLQGAQKVSIQQLLKEPNRYKGKLVSVYGYASLSLGNSKIYGSEESFKNQNNNDAVLYFQPKEDTYVILKKFKEGYAEIVGLFNTVDESECDGVVYDILIIDIPK